MLGSLSPDEKRVMSELWWSAPMAKFHGMTFGGLGLMVVAQIALFIEATSGSGGFSTATLVILVIMLVGFGVGAAGLFLRRNEFNRLAYRTCPQCGQMNFASSSFCRKCGAPASVGPVPAASSAPLSAPST
jgi:hypothetical protein